MSIPIRSRIRIASSDITSVKVYSDQNDDRYYFGENAIIRAHIENLSAVKVITWHWKKDGRSTCIDTTKEKFLGTSCNPIDEPKLIINNCCESDVGIYYLLVACKDVEICSNEIKLKVVKGIPLVTLNRIPSTVSNECVEIKATIRSFPQHDRVTWKKNREKIDITLPKYDGSTDIGNSPILCIKNVQKRNDEGIYTIIVHNKLGEGNDKSKLVIIEVSNMVFISGPVAVSPKGKINFQAYKSDKKFSKAKWWKIRNNSAEELMADTTKYLMYQKNNIHEIEILDANEEDCGAYQFSLDEIRSNKIYTTVDGSGKYLADKQENCLRLFALQAIGADAMRKVFVNPADFEEKKNNFKKSFSKDNEKLKLLSGKYEFFLVYKFIIIFTI